MKNANDRVVVSCGVDGLIHVVDFRERTEAVPTTPQLLWHCCQVGTGRLALSGTKEIIFRLIDGSSIRRIGPTLPHRGNTRGVCCDGASSLCSTSVVGECNIWNLHDLFDDFETEQPKSVNLPHSSSIPSACWGGNGVLFTASESTLRSWDVIDGVRLTEHHCESRISSVCTLSDYGLICIGTHGSCARLFDSRATSCVGFLPARSPVTSVCPVESGFALGTSEGSLVVWDARSHANRTADSEIRLHLPQAHTKAVSDLASEGRRIGSVSLDKTAKVWNADGRCIRKKRFSERQTGVVFLEVGDEAQVN